MGEQGVEWGRIVPDKGSYVSIKPRRNVSQTGLRNSLQVEERQVLVCKPANGATCFSSPSFSPSADICCFSLSRTSQSSFWNGFLIFFEEIPQIPFHCSQPMWFKGSRHCPPILACGQETQAWPVSKHDVNLAAVMGPPAWPVRNSPGALRETRGRQCLLSSRGRWADRKWACGGRGQGMDVGQLYLRRREASWREKQHQMREGMGGRKERRKGGGKRDRKEEKVREGIR